MKNSKLGRFAQRNSAMAVYELEQRNKLLKHSHSLVYSTQQHATEKQEQHKNRGCIAASDECTIGNSFSQSKGTSRTKFLQIGKRVLSGQQVTCRVMKAK